MQLPQPVIPPEVQLALINRSRSTIHRVSLTVMDSEVPLLDLVSVGQKRREAEVSTAIAYINRRRVHTPRHERWWYLV